MKIRNMAESDIEDLALLYRQFWGEESAIDAMKKKYKLLKKNPHYIFLSAVKDNHLIGSVQGIICEELYGACRPFLVIENFIVDNEHRRKGVGRSLILEIEKVATERGCYQVLFITENHRSDAVYFYQSLGFSLDSHKGFKKALQVLNN